MTANLRLTFLLAVSGLLAGCTINVTSPPPHPLEPSPRMEIARTLQLRTLSENEALSLTEGCERQETMATEGHAGAGAKRIVIVTCGHGDKAPSTALDALMGARMRLDGDTALSAEDRKVILDTLDEEIRRRSVKSAD
ncbi:MAG: hypothetical protein KGS00_07165 [Alphaproteobacteria bacterium]|nr:hypothetical protein [Alphaproteobacteria bacterium]